MSHPGEILDAQSPEDCLEHLPQLLEGDQVRLQQILINLTKNALKFTHNGRITIWTAYDHSKECLHVHVVDTGKGIKQNELQKLFHMFGMVERTQEQFNPDGLGMGLNICQQILQKCSGNIEVSSQGENQGSTFKFQMRMHLPRPDSRSA